MMATPRRLSNNLALAIFGSLAVFCAGFASLAVAQSDLYDNAFPPGVNWNNATPEQIADAVFAAVKNNPDAAPDIAVNGLQAAAGTGRWSLVGAEDGKQAVDPDGSSGDPSLQDIANVIGDAAKRGNPAMAPQIDSAIAGALPGLMSGVGGAGGGGGGGGGGPPPVPSGFGGGGGGSTGSTGDS